MTATEEIQQLGRRWAAAEVRGDTAELDAMTTDDFTMVGPVGFVLDKAQWLARYSDGLVTKQLNWEDVHVREYGKAAVSIGTQDQVLDVRGNPVNGKLRITHVFVQVDDQWRIAGLQLSPIMGEPPFGMMGRPA